MVEVGDRGGGQMNQRPNVLHRPQLEHTYEHGVVFVPKDHHVPHLLSIAQVINNRLLYVYERRRGQLHPRPAEA